jgi:flagellar secretion chaperone FliS
LTNQVFANRYREVAVKTANPLQLIVILYDAAICSLRQAQEHIENKNIEGRSRSINKCIAIISELQCSLNLNNGGDIARSLDRLYDYMKTRIFAASAQQSAQPLAESEALLENLRSAWRALAEQTSEGAEPANRQDLPTHAVIGASTPAAAMQLKPFNVSI